MTIDEYRTEIKRLLSDPKFQIIKPAPDLLNKVYKFNKDKPHKWIKDLVDYFCTVFSEHHVWCYDDFKVEDPEYKLWVNEQRKNGVKITIEEEKDAERIDFVIDDSSSVGRFLRATGVKTMQEAMDVYRERRKGKDTSDETS